MIAIEYPYLKISELLLFFHRFKAGRYGHFYGNVDPLRITTALREFISERNNIIADFESKQTKEKHERDMANAITREEWLEMKQKKGIKL